MEIGEPGPLGQVAQKRAQIDLLTTSLSKPDPAHVRTPPRHLAETNVEEDPMM